MVYPLYIELGDYRGELYKCLKNKNRFIPLTLNSKLPMKKINIENHANIILIDKDLKNIEVFEPHGYKGKESTIYESVSKYHNKISILKLFFKELLPDYKLINVVDYIPNNQSFQSKYDSNSGYCVSWSTLYVHYRLLNQKKSIKNLMEYLNDLIDVNLLLRYAKYIEDVLKKKI